MASKKELERRLSRLEAQINQSVILAEYPWESPEATLKGRMDAIEDRLGIKTTVHGPTPAKVVAMPVVKAEDAPAPKRGTRAGKAKKAK